MGTAAFDEPMGPALVCTGFVFAIRARVPGELHNDWQRLQMSMFVSLRLHRDLHTGCLCQ